MLVKECPYISSEWSQIGWSYNRLCLMLDVCCDWVRNTQHLGHTPPFWWIGPYAYSCIHRNLVCRMVVEGRM